jgi:hypothetical protein
VLLGRNSFWYETVQVTCNQQPLGVAMKHTSTARAIATSALFTSLLAGCSSWPWEQQDGSGEGAMGGGMRGTTASGYGGDSADCDQHRQMSSPGTPSDQLAIMEQNMRRMSPAMRERHMSRMRQTCGAASQPDDNR